MINKNNHLLPLSTGHQPTNPQLTTTFNLHPLPNQPPTSPLFQPATAVNISPFLQPKPLPSNLCKQPTTSPSSFVSTHKPNTVDSITPRITRVEHIFHQTIISTRSWCVSFKQVSTIGQSRNTLISSIHFDFNVHCSNFNGQRSRVVKKSH